MKTYIQWVVKFLIYATFFVPLVVIPTGFIFPFIVPKILLFRSLAMLMLGGYVLLLIINWQEFKPKFTVLNLALAAFLLSFAISTFAGVDPYHSFWDNHERMLGLFTIFHFVAYYFVCSNVFKTWVDWKWALRIFLCAGAVVMFIAFLQTQNPELLLNMGSSRTSSTLGNPIYVGGYSLFLIFVALLLFFREKNPVWRGAEVLMGLLAVLGIFWSGTRGSLLGLSTGIGAALIGYVFVLKDHPKVRWSLLGVVVLCLATIGLLYNFRQTDLVKNMPTIGRAVNTTLTGIKSSPRWIAWGIAVESWKAKPIFGWGPNNFFYAFNKYYEPRSLNFGYGETWFDNAHNILMNTLAVQGTFGILVYLGIFGVGVACLIAARRRNGLNYHIVVFGLAFLAAHLVNNVTVFENPTSYLYFMFWLAMVNQLTMNNEQLTKDKAKTSTLHQPTSIQYLDKKIGFGVIATASVLVLISIFIFDFQPARANMLTLKALQYLGQDLNLAMPAVKTALSFNSPHIDDIRADIARITGQLLAEYYEKIGKERSKEFLDLAYEGLQKNLILHPLDIRNHLTLAQLAQIGFVLTNDNQYLVDAERFLTDARRYSPRRQQILYGLATVRMQRGEYGGAVEVLEQALLDNPKIGESYWRLAFIHKVFGDAVKMTQVLQLAGENGVNFSEQEQGIIGNLLNPQTTIATSVKK